MSDPKTRPDGIILHNYRKVARDILKSAEKNGVKSIIFNAGFSKDSQMGVPGNPLKQWIAQLVPDDEFAGELLGKKLFEEALKLPGIDAQEKILVIGLQGGRASYFDFNLEELIS